MYFILLTFEKMTGLSKINLRLALNLTRVYTLMFVILGWVTFRAKTIGDAFDYYKSMFGMNNNRLADGVFAAWISQYAVIIVCAIIFSTPLVRIASRRLIGQKLYEYMKVFACCTLFVLSVASLVSSSYNPFIYFNF